MLNNNTVVLGLLPLYDYYQARVKPLIGPMAAIVDIEEVIVGEMYLLMGAPHEPNQPTFRKLVYNSCPTEIRHNLLEGFNTMAYEILKQADSVQSDYVEVSPLSGYALAVKPVYPQEE